MGSTNGVKRVQMDWINYKNISEWGEKNKNSKLLTKFDPGPQNYTLLTLSLKVEQPC